MLTKYLEQEMGNDEKSMWIGLVMIGLVVGAMFAGCKA